MFKELYNKLLLHPKWKIKRILILKRDKHTCRKCKSHNNLQVHHTYYFYEGRNPWEYPNESLITLCKKCHEEIHNNTPISEFFRHENSQKNIKNNNVSKSNPARRKLKKNKKEEKRKEKITLVKKEQEERRNRKRLKSPIYKLPEYQHLVTDIIKN